MIILAYGSIYAMRESYGETRLHNIERLECAVSVRVSRAICFLGIVIKTQARKYLLYLPYTINCFL